MSIPSNHSARELAKFKESSTTAGQTGIVVVNPDGSNVGASVTVTADTEFPAAALLADAAAIPTTTKVGSVGMTYNGTTLDFVRSGQTSNSATVTGFPNQLPMAKYNATPTARTEGQFGNLQADANGSLNQNLATLIAGEDQTNNVLAQVVKPLAVNTYALSVDRSAASEASSVTKASAGNLFVAYGYNGNAALRYIQFYNSTTVPADTAVPVISIPVPATSTFSLDLSAYGDYFSTGIAWANSTTLATKTVGSADTFMNVYYL